MDIVISIAIALVIVIAILLVDHRVRNGNAKVDPLMSRLVALESRVAVLERAPKDAVAVAEARQALKKAAQRRSLIDIKRDIEAGIEVSE